MHRMSSRVMGLAVLVAAAAGCPGGGGGAATGTQPIHDTPPIDQGTDLPGVPAKIVTTASEPFADNDAAAASPILGWMAQENERWMKELGKKSEPAFYLGYQIVEQRAVNLTAEGGALI